MNMFRANAVLLYCGDVNDLNCSHTGTTDALTDRGSNMHAGFELPLQSSLAL